MSKQVNYPYTINTLSAKGSAEVIARGITNDYITKWTYNTGALATWDNVENFPTVVRTGNFVWCWYEERDNRGIWMLIDVVPDPEVEYQLGNNIAYPALLNDSVGGFDATTESGYAVTAENVKTNHTSITNAVTDGPYYPLTVSDHHTAIISNATNANSGRAGFWDTTNFHYDKIVAHKWGDTPNVWGGFATTANHRVPLLIGWGPYQSLLSKDNSNDGDYLYGLWPPFATYEQFQTLYGAEKDWVYEVLNTNYKTLFGPTYRDTILQHSAGVRYTNTADIENEYPFTVEAMQPQTKYRNVPGDTTGDGFDNTPSLEDALEVYAVATALVPGLDPTKCEGFPGDLIPGLDMSAINEKLNGVKAGIETAIASTGLLDLEKKLEGFKASIEDKFPKAVEVLNFVEDLASLDPKELITNLADDVVDLAGETVGNAIGDLKEKWKDTVEDVDSFVDGIVEGIANFDICSTIGLQGKTGADGKLVKKPETPSVPDKDIEEPVQSAAVATTGKNTPQDSVQAATGTTPAKYEQAYTDWYNLWTELKNDDTYVWAKYLRDGPKQWDKLMNLVKGPDYVTASEAFNAKQPIPLSKGRLDEMRAEMREIGLSAAPYKKMSGWINMYQTKMQQNIHNERGNYFPTPDYDIHKTPPIAIGKLKLEPVGAIYGGGNSLNVSFQDQANYDLLSKFQEQMSSAIKKYFFDEDGINIQLLWMARWSGFINDPKHKQRIIDAISEGQPDDADAVDDRVGDLPTEDFKGTVPGQVVYKYVKDKIDPKTGRIIEKGTTRNQPIQPALFNILAASAAEKNYTIEIYSGGQDYFGTRNARREGSKRHDGGFAADIKVKTDTGRRLSAHGTGKDIKALREFVLILLKNGATAIGAGDPFNYSGYMDGNLHVDIATKSPHKLSSACWGALGTSYRRAYAPLWLTSAFDNRV